MAFPGKPTIHNLTLTNSNQEYSHTVPENTFKLMAKARSTSAAVKFAFTSGASGTTYMTIPAGQTYWDDNVNTSVTMYFQSTTAGTVVEIQTWQGS